MLLGTACANASCKVSIRCWFRPVSLHMPLSTGVVELYYSQTCVIQVIFFDFYLSQSLSPAIVFLHCLPSVRPHAIEMVILTWLIDCTIVFVTQVSLGTIVGIAWPYWPSTPHVMITSASGDRAASHVSNVSTTRSWRPPECRGAVYVFVLRVRVLKLSLLRSLTWRIFHDMFYFFYCFFFSVWQVCNCEREVALFTHFARLHADPSLRTTSLWGDESPRRDVCCFVKYCIKWRLLHVGLLTVGMHWCRSSWMYCWPVCTRGVRKLPKLPIPLLFKLISSHSDHIYMHILLKRQSHRKIELHSRPP